MGAVGHLPTLEQSAPAPQASARVRRLNPRIDIVVNDTFTKLQGQYLAFIATYAKLHRRPPAEADLQEYFGVTPPSVHNMILTLERHGFIARTAGRARSIEVLIPRNMLPELE